MFNFSGSEILFLLVAGLVVLGPERLPGVISRVVRTYSEVRKMAGNLEKEFRDTFEEPLRDIRSAGDEIRRGFGQVDDGPSPPMRPEKAELPPAGTGEPAGQDDPLTGEGHRDEESGS